MRSIGRTFLVVAMALALLLAAAPGPAGAASAMTVAVQVGAATADHAVEAWQFFPAAITIDAGDTVTWHFADPVYTVSFGPAPSDANQMLAPAGGASYDGTGFVSSGLPLAFAPPGPFSYSLTFPKVGTYAYQSLFHPTMRGTVVVQPAGTAYPSGQASYQPATDPRLQAALSAGTSALPAQRVVSRPNGDGTTTYALAAGDGDGASYGLLRFGAPILTIHAGDTVAWTQRDPNELHTVTFLDRGQDVAFLVGGKINPAGASPSGGKTYAGSGFFNSGVLTPNQGYALTFSAAGTYNYVCLIHDELGMKASITVLAAAGAPQTPVQIPAQMPNTGAGGGAAAWSSLALLGLLLIGLATVSLVRRRAR